MSARSLPLLVLIAVGFATGGYCQEASQPVELVRSFRVQQDLVAHGNLTAQITQKMLLAQIADRLDQFADVTWDEPKNVRAVIEFVLSGGNPRVLKAIVSRGAAGISNAKLAKGVLAYSEGRNAEAAAMLSALDARSLDPSIAGQVALVQAELVAKKDTARVATLLDQARLLSPGTLIEEAALRRLATIFAAVDNFQKFEEISEVYLRRFPKSLYAGQFKQQFAMQVAMHEQAQDAHRKAKLTRMLTALDVNGRREVFITIANEAILRGRIALARFAAGEAASLAEKDTLDEARAALYMAAADVATDQVGSALVTLATLDRARFSKQDAELLAAAISLAHQIMGSAPTSAGATRRVHEAASNANSNVVEPARQAIARVDQLLKGEKK